MSAGLEAEQRARVVAAARGWIGTRFHHRGRVKGAGVDCATLIAEAYEEAGLIPRLEMPPYSSQWHLNEDEEKYLAVIRRYFRQIDGPPLPGDLVLWKLGRRYGHAAIVTDWPRIIHPLWGSICQEDDAETCAQLQRVAQGESVGGVDDDKPRPRMFFSFWGTA